MEIRELKPSELDKLLQLYRCLHEADDPLPDGKVVGEMWREIQSDRRQVIFGVFEDENLVSSCVLNIIPNLTRGCRPYALVENVITHPDHRRRGLGKALMQHTVQYASAQGCYKVMLLTGRKNKATYRFYESAGFDRNEKQAFVIKIKKR